MSESGLNFMAVARSTNLHGECCTVTGSANGVLIFVYNLRFIQILPLNLMQQQQQQQQQPCSPRHSQRTVKAWI
ncbi:MAG: hypothetical protein MUE72_12940, partial [Chitinophagaceae bacterium]|nr:hypothetical protein [Chitinophagaceae bacterium]